MKNHPLKTLVLALGVSVAAVGMSASANAGSLRQGSTASSGAVVGSRPAADGIETRIPPVDLCPPGTGPGDLCNTVSDGDNIIRLINPNGSGNGNLAGAKTQTVCAMLYIFDDDQEMGECCGCPLSSTQLATFSVQNNLTSDWGLQGGPEGLNGFPGETSVGSFAVVAAAPNTTACTGGGGGAACNGGCDPTDLPGYSVTSANNLLGSITHDQIIVTPILSTTSAEAIAGVTETALTDDSGGEPINLIYLQTQCGALVGNGTGGGICNCPTEG